MSLPRPVRDPPKADDDCWDVAARETMTVLIDDEAPVPTGLVDQWGTPIYRKPVRHKVGF